MSSSYTDACILFCCLVLTIGANSYALLAAGRVKECREGADADADDGAHRLHSELQHSGALGGRSCLDKLVPEADGEHFPATAATSVSDCRKAGGTACPPVDGITEPSLFLDRRRHIGIGGALSSLHTTIPAYPGTGHAHIWW